MGTKKIAPDQSFVYGLKAHCNPHNNASRMVNIPINLPQKETTTVLIIWKVKLFNLYYPFGHQPGQYILFHFMYTVSYMKISIKNGCVPVN